MEDALKFVKGQKLMAVASYCENDIWIANVYFGVDEKGTLYFVSTMDAKHSQMILKNPSVAFSIAWFDPANDKNRKGIQGNGVCRIAKNLREVTTGVKLLYEKFPDLRNIFTNDWISTNIWNSKVWILEPSRIKYWDDEIYGDNESQEFTID